MNKTESKINYFSNIQKKIKENMRFILILLTGIITIFAFFQIYLFYKNKNILDTSIVYNYSKHSDSQSEFLRTMNEIVKENNFYSLLASLEIINHKIKNNNYKEVYEDYLNVLNKNNLGNIYRTLIAIHASYNLIDKIDNNKLTNLLSYVDESLDSFVGYHFEILYLLSLTQGNIEENKSLYLQIIQNEKIPSSIKERVYKINAIEKYK